MDGFYWLIDGALAGCRRPGLRWRRGLADPAADAVGEDLLAPCGGWASAPC